MEHSSSTSIKARMMARAPNVSPTNKGKKSTPSSLPQQHDEKEQQQQQQNYKKYPPSPFAEGTSIARQKVSGRGKAGSDAMESSGNKISPYTGNRADRPSGNVFTVQYVSFGTRRRINHGSMGNASPTPLAPLAPKSSRTDLSMADQYTNAWSELVLARYHQRTASPTEEDPTSTEDTQRCHPTEKPVKFVPTLNLNTGFCYDKNSESLALRSMVSAALGRQALATDGNNQRFLRVIKGAKAAKEQVNNTGSNNSHVDISSFVAIYKQLLADIMIVHDQHGYEKTVKCFLQLEPWLLGK